MKKLLKFIVLPIMLLSCALMVSGCLDKPEDKIAIHTPFKTVYYVGEELDVIGGILNYTKDGKTTQVAITNTMITGFNTLNAGNYNMIITYEGLTVVVPYTINNIPELTLNCNIIYKSEYITSPGGYYYVKFLSQNSVGVYGSEEEYTTANPPSMDHFTYGRAQIVSKELIGGKWVLTAYDTNTTADNRITIIITFDNTTPVEMKLVVPNGDSLTYDLFVC